MTALLDVNVLIALAWPNHEHHRTAWEWFHAQMEEGWATCALTEAGFVRISCNPAIVSRETTPLEAIGVLAQLMQVGSHSFWPLDRSIVNLPESIRTRLQGHRQITDAVLLATAMQQNGELATFDAGTAALSTQEEQAYIRVIPA